MVELGKTCGHNNRPNLFFYDFILQVIIYGAKRTNLLTEAAFFRFSAGGGSAFGGQNLQNLSPEERQQRLQELGGNVGGARLRQGFGGQGLATGEIISKDDKSVTVKLRDGGSKIVFLSGSIEVTKSVSGTLVDLEVGKNISVNGTANSDGSITAQSIQLRPNLQ